MRSMNLDVCVIKMMILLSNVGNVIWSSPLRTGILLGFSVEQAAELKLNGVFLISGPVLLLLRLLYIQQYLLLLCFCLFDCTCTKKAGTAAAAVINSSGVSVCSYKKSYPGACSNSVQSTAVLQPGGLTLHPIHATHRTTYSAGKYNSSSTRIYLSQQQYHSSSRKTS